MDVDRSPPCLPLDRSPVLVEGFRTAPFDRLLDALLVHCAVDPVANVFRNIFEDRCQWCDHVKLVRRRPRWFELPLVLLAIHPYVCPHCFLRTYRSPLRDDG